MKKIRTVEEIMEMVESLSPRKLYEFKGEFETYIKEVAGMFNVVETKSIVTKPVETKKGSKAETKKESKENEFKEFFSKVKETGVEHGKEIDPETKPILAINKKDTDECIVAALVNNNGIATNAVWSTAYKYPVVFGKLSFEELIAIKEEMIKVFPDDAEIIETNDGPNGDDNNFYYDELEEGNFCNRFVNDKGETVYFGYIIDENMCFYKNADDSISIIDVKYFFMPRWGTKETKDDYKEKTDTVIALINRAFGDNDGNELVKETIEQVEEKIEHVSKSKKDRRKSFNEEEIEDTEIDTSLFRRKNRKNRG